MLEVDEDLGRCQPHVASPSNAGGYPAKWVVFATPRKTWNATRTPEPGKHYCLLRVTQSYGDLLETAPAWVTVAGGVLHADRYQNSVLYDARPGVDGVAGSTLMQHFSYVANRRDVWYVANGWLYCYRFVAEHVRVAK